MYVVKKQSSHVRLKQIQGYAVASKSLLDTFDESICYLRKRRLSRQLRCQVGNPALCVYIPQVPTDESGGPRILDASLFEVAKSVQRAIEEIYDQLELRPGLFELGFHIGGLHKYGV